MIFILLQKIDLYVFFLLIHKVYIYYIILNIWYIMKLQDIII